MEKDMDTALLHATPDSLPIARPDNVESLFGRSSLVSRNITISAHRTSIRLEPDMWSALRDICRRERASMHELCTTVVTHKPANSSLTAAIRVFIMAYFRAASTEDGHSKAGHGPGGSLFAMQKPVSSAEYSSRPLPFSSREKPHGSAVMR